MIHKIDCRKGLARMLVVGCGGTGTAFASGLPFLHQAAKISRRAGFEVMIADPDRISSTNCVRQAFSESEIGLHKATVVVNRLNLFWGLDWHACPEALSNKTKGVFDILVTCVDTRAARFAITRSPLFQNVAYWLDIGNNADNGQFVLGQPRNSRNRCTKHRMPTVAELYPEILDFKLDGKDGLPSCSAAEALEKQEPFVNQVLANHALALLARLFRHGEISYQGGFVNLATGRMASIPVTERERVKRNR